jgi:hypothetical protein
MLPKQPRLFDYDKMAKLLRATKLRRPMRRRITFPTRTSTDNSPREDCRDPQQEPLAADQRANIDYKQEATTYPESFLYFVRGRDSLRTYITALFTSQIAIYDGAMGTMIQNYAKRNKPRRGRVPESFKEWDTEGNNTC